MGIIGNIVNGVFGGGTEGPGQRDENALPDASKYGYNMGAASFNHYNDQAQNIQNRSGPGFQAQGATAQAAQIDQGNANRGLLASAAGLQGAAGIGNQQQALANNLNATINGTAGPSVAQLTMQQQAGQALRNNLAMASAGTGASHGGALINAGNQNAMQQGATAQQAGILRAQEIQNAQGQLGNVLGGMRGQLGQEAGQYTQNAALAGNLAAQQAGLQQQTNLANQQAFQQNAQFNAGLGAQQYNQQQQRNDAANQFYSGLGFNALQGDAANRAHAEDLRVQSELAQKGYGIQQQQANNQLTGSVLGSIGGALGSMAVLSDIRAKENISPMRLDDTYAKLGSYGYDYRNGEPGRHFGPMAQELEQTPAGRSVVGQGPNGKTIDAGRLSVLNASHQGELERRLQGIEAALGKPTEYPGGNSMPQAGYMPGKMHLDPNLAPAVPSGQARPFAPGEYVRNPDQSWSSEVSMTVQNPSLNGGKPTVIPSMWLKNGKPYIARDEDEAAELAKRSGLPFRSYGSMQEAEKASIDRESAWQPLERPEDAKMISPLWAQPKKIEPTDLMFSADHGGTFRTPAEQYGYTQGLKEEQALQAFRQAHRDESTRTVPTLDQFRAAHVDESTRPTLAQRGFAESTQEYDSPSYNVARVSGRAPVVTSISRPERNPYAGLEENPYTKGQPTASNGDAKKKLLASLLQSNAGQLGQMGNGPQAQLIPVNVAPVNLPMTRGYGY